jgi:hypothetical protein
MSKIAVPDEPPKNVHKEVKKVFTKIKVILCYNLNAVTACSFLFVLSKKWRENF